MNMAIARVFADPLERPQDFLGTAFAVSDLLALTAFHCVGDRVSNVHREQVWLSFQTGASVQAQYDGVDPYADFAVLRLLDELPDDLHWLPLTTDTFRREKFDSPGYPSAVKMTGFYTVSGDVKNPSASVENAEAIELFCRESAAGLSLHGLSGAPVIVGNPPTAVGIVRWNPPASQDPLLAAGATLYACPIKAAAARRPDLKRFVRDRTPDELIGEALPLLKTASDETREIITAELGRLNRAKVFSHRCENLQSEWISLPCFKYTQALAGSNEHTVRKTVKLIFQVIATGLTQVFSPSLKEIQFVMLCEVSFEAGCVAVSVYCPFQELVAFCANFMRSSTSIYRPWSWPRALMTSLQSRKISVHHDYKLPTGCLVPIVVAYQPSLLKIALSNLNHFANPDQFLSPHRCHTTSGFLNFLGACSLKHELQKRINPDAPQLILLEHIEGAFGKGLDQWFRWLYHVLDRGTWETQRIFVGNKNPEEYIYSYDP